MATLARSVAKSALRRWLWRALVAAVGLKLLFLGLLTLIILALTGVMQEERRREAARQEESLGLPLPDQPAARAEGAPTGPIAPAAGAIDIGAPDPARAQQGFSYTAPAAIDYDGDPFAYAPPTSGLPTSDYLANAGRPGNWWGLETDTGKPSGTPKVRSDGYYISQTSLRLHGRSLDARVVPFVALPHGYMGAKLGDYALVTNNSTGQRIWAVFGDVSPRQARVEVSPAAAKALGVGFTKGGTTSNAGSLTVTIYPGTRNLTDLAARVGGR
ncbi:MAG: hypothetical protein JSR82_08050 [Verrucomicrobia bacterium]|nr:hypothetical protein [Verrucomicrobiota bacterium]